MCRGDVARYLGLSIAGVAKHDAELAPIRAANGTRLYDAARVAAFAARRDQRRDEITARKAAKP